ncbi:MAG: hypothetical protein ACREF3_08780, partial [Acetobacteraceae bacterium]
AMTILDGFQARRGQPRAGWRVVSGSAGHGQAGTCLRAVIARSGAAKQSFAMLRPGGVATIIGMIPVGVKIELHGADFLRDRKIQGTSMGGNHFRVDMPRLLELWRQGRLQLETLISGRITLDKINEGFANLKSGAPVRQLIDFGVV